MKLPSSVRVGPYNITLQPMSQEYFSMCRNLGEFHQTDLVIKMRLDLPNQQIINTLIHEILHACWYVQGLENFDGKTEESVVNSLSNSLTQVFYDNPELLKLLVKECK